MIKNKGFTIIELLISISLMIILGLLALLVINPGKVQSKTRDGVRVNDLRSIQSALEVYLADMKVYPNTNGAWEKVFPNSILANGLVQGRNQYLKEVPKDPSSSDTSSNPKSPCESLGDYYRYNYVSDGSTYILTAIFENENSNSGHTCSASDLTNWSIYSCGVALSTCYGVQNPK